RVDARRVAVHRVPRRRPPAPRPQEHPRRVAVHPRVAQRAHPVQQHSRPVAPAPHVVDHAPEARVAVEPRVVVVRLIREVLPRPPKLGPRPVSVRPAIGPPPPPPPPPVRSADSPPLFPRPLRPHSATRCPHPP